MIKAIIFDLNDVLLHGDEPDKQLLAFIAEQKSKFKFAILSNSVYDRPAHLLSAQELKLFDDIVLSHQVGLAKPQTKIYTLAAKRLGLAPNQCVYVDDKNSRTQGAAKTGMQTILYKNFDDFKTKLGLLLKK